MSETLAQLPDEAFPHQLPCAFAEAFYELICVTLASLESLVFNVRLQTEIVGIKSGDYGSQSSLGVQLVLHNLCRVFWLSCGLKRWFNAYVLSRLEHCAPVCMSREESCLGVLDSIIHSEEMLQGGEVWSIEGWSVLCVYSITCVTEWTTLWMSISSILL